MVRSQSPASSEQMRRGGCGHVIHDVDGAGPIYAAVPGAGGRWYYSDEYHHRVVVQEPTGYHWSIGAPGAGPGEFRHPRGLAFLEGEGPEECRLFVCDAWNHRVQVFDALGRFLFAFGREGRGMGQFDVPSDLALVRPEFPGEDLEEGDAEATYLAVADRWNNRVQIFEPDGAFVAAVGGLVAGTQAPHGADGRPLGWPHFRYGLDPTTSFPVRLEWKAPHLLVTSANGRVLSIDLAAALLPEFEAWRLAATSGELEAARLMLSHQPSTPPDVLASVDTSLGAARLAAGRSREAGLAWAQPWPPGMPAELVEQQLVERFAVIEDAAVRAGRAPVRLLQALSTRVALERRKAARHEAALDLARTLGSAVAASRRLTSATASGASIRLNQLAGRIAVMAKLPAPSARTIWTAPAGEGDLRQIASDGQRLALIAGRQPALWILSLCGEPLARFALPAGTEPRGVAPARGGGWFVSDVEHDSVVRLDDDGKLVSRWGGRRVPDALRYPLALAACDERLFLADRDHHRVEVFTTNGDAIGGYPRLHAPSAVAVDATTLWVGEWGRSPAVRALDLATGEPQQVLSHRDLSSPSAIVVMDDLVVVADAFGASVHAFSRDGRWLGRAWRGEAGAFGRITGLAPANGYVVAVDRDHATLVRLDLPDGAHPWPQH